MDGPNLPKSSRRTDCDLSKRRIGLVGTVEGTFEPTTLLEGKGLKKQHKRSTRTKLQKKIFF